MARIAKRRRIVGVAAFAVFAAACGPIFGVDFDGHAAPDGDPTHDTNPTETPDSDAAPTGTSEASTDGGGKAPGTDGGAPDAAADATPDSGPATGPIHPLAVGRSWTYDVTEIGSAPSCPSGSHDWVVVNQEMHMGQSAFVLRPFCTGAPFGYYYVQSTDVIWRDTLGAWELTVDAPVKEGHTWSNSVSTFKWHDIGSYTVPAGTFSSCFDLLDTNGPSHTVFCRGVGPVHQVFRTAAGNGFDATLTKKNF